MARSYALSVLVFVALAGVATAEYDAPAGFVSTNTFDCALFKTTCVDTNVAGVGAYADCAATVTANTGMNMTNMTCREYHLSVASSNMTDRTSIETHCPHAAENATGPCKDQDLVGLPPTDNAAYSVSTFSFAALVLALIVASAQL